MNYSLTAKDQDDCDSGVKRFCDAHPRLRWTVTGAKRQGGFALIVNGSAVYFPLEVIVNRVHNMSDSVFTALEQLRDGLRHREVASSATHN
jgi:hypothetical protein